MFQPNFPLKISNTTGAYESISDIKQNIKQNVLFLLSVSPGEWPGNPELGVGVKKFLFENHTSSDLLSIHKNIKDQFSRFLPFLDVRSELIDTDMYGEKLVDSGEMKLIIKYNIKPLGVSDSVSLGISEGT